MAQLEFAAGGFLFACQQFDQRGFAGSVHSHKRNAVALLDEEADVAEDFFFASVGFGIALGDSLELGHDAAAGLGLGEREVNRFFFRRNFDPLDLFQLLDAALHLLGLGGLVAEAVDEYFQLLDAVALVAVSGLQLLVALRLLRQKFVVVAGVEPEPLVPDFRDLVDHYIEEVAVVRDQHQCMRIIVQIFFQPVARFEIEVVGGFVQQEQVRLLQEQFGERQPHLPAARKFVGLALPVFFAKAQPLQHAPHFSFDRVAVAGAEFVLQAVIAVGDVGVLRAGVIELRDFMSELFQFPLDGVQSGEHRHAFGKHSAAGKREAILREISCGRSLGDDERAVVEGVEACENLHQRGFAGAVRAHQSDAVVGRDQPVGVFKKKFVAETFSGAGELNHGLESSSHKTAVPST